jgi:hypothetical protein
MGRARAAESKDGREEKEQLAWQLGPKKEGVGSINR